MTFAIHKDIASDISGFASPYIDTNFLRIVTAYIYIKPH